MPGHAASAPRDTTASPIFTPERVVEIAFQAAGAATGPLLADHPGYVFPAERVAERVTEVLAEFGIEAHGNGDAFLIDCAICGRPLALPSPRCGNEARHPQSLGVSTG